MSDINIIDFDFLKDICPKYIDLMTDNNIIPNAKSGDYYTSESVAEAIVCLLQTNMNRNEFYDTNSYIENNEIIVEQSDLIFDKKYMYCIYIEGYNKEIFGEGETSNVGHVFVLLNVNNQWNIIDAFVPFRKLKMWEININELYHFIKINEKKIDIDYYNHFFDVNLNNSYITHLDVLIQELEWSGTSSNILNNFNNFNINDF